MYRPGNSCYVCMAGLPAICRNTGSCLLFQYFPPEHVHACHQTGVLSFVLDYHLTKYWAPSLSGIVTARWHALMRSFGTPHLLNNKSALVTGIWDLSPLDGNFVTLQRRRLELFYEVWKMKQGITALLKGE